MKFNNRSHFPFQAILLHAAPTVVDVLPMDPFSPISHSGLIGPIHVHTWKNLYLCACKNHHTTCTQKKTNEALLKSQMASLACVIIGVNDERSQRTILVALVVPSL